jgi:hypothetical protein
LTKAKSKADWIKAWKNEVGHLTRMYQCKADPDLFDRIKVHVDMLNQIVEEIGDKMEEEGVWNKTDLRNLKTAYDEWIHCGNKGSFDKYCLSVGVRLEDLG